MNIESYIKDGEKFVPIGAFKGKIVDPDYIEGSIEMRASGVALLTKELWDYVDQLWWYLLDASIKAAENNEASFCFPDQPIEVKIAPLYKLSRIKFSVRTERWVSAVIESGEFFCDVCRAGDFFFNRMRSVLPEHDDRHLLAIKKINYLRSIKPQ